MENIKDLKRKCYNMHKLKYMLPHQFQRFFKRLVDGEVTYKNRFNQIIDYKEPEISNIFIKETNEEFNNFID